jgi:hypothetical protein
MASTHISTGRTKSKSNLGKINWDEAWGSFKENIKKDPEEILDEFRKDGWLCIEDFCKLIDRSETQARIIQKRMAKEGKLELRREQIKCGTKTILCRPVTS